MQEKECKRKRKAKEKAGSNRGGSDDDDASDRDGGGGATSLEAVRDKAQRAAAGEQLVRREGKRGRAGELLTRLEAAETAREQLDEELRHRLEDERLESESRSAGGVSASNGM